MNFTEKHIALRSLISSLVEDIKEYKDPENYKIVLELRAFIIDKCRLIDKLDTEIQEEKGMN